MNNRLVKKVRDELRNAGIEFEIIEHRVDGAKSRDAALALGIGLDRIVKTLVLKGERQFYLAIISGDARLDFRKARRAFSNGKLRFALPREIFEKTGYNIGGVPPFGHRTKMPTIIDQKVLLSEHVFASAGSSRHGLKIKSQDLVKIVGAKISDITNGLSSTTLATTSTAPPTTLATTSTAPPTTLATTSTAPPTERELILRNIAELVTENELNELMESKRRISTYCGYEMSGPVTVGTACTVQKQIDFQKAGWDVYVLYPDIHTYINKKGEFKLIREMEDYWKTAFVALGLDREKTKFVLGSSFQFEQQYVFDIFRASLHVSLGRAQRAMDIVGREMGNPRVSQMLYPIMQVLDIAESGLDIDVAHGGLEQRHIHMLARDVLPKIGYKKPVCLHNKLLSSFLGPSRKMSKSNPESIITVHEKPSSLKRKIMRSYCPEAQVKDNFVFQIIQLLIFPRNGHLEIPRTSPNQKRVVYNSLDKLESDYIKRRLHPLDLKIAASESLNEILSPIRRAVREMRTIPDLLKTWV